MQTVENAHALGALRSTEGSPEELLRAALTQNAVRVTDLFRQWDHNGYRKRGSNSRPSPSFFPLSSLLLFSPHGREFGPHCGSDGRRSFFFKKYI